MFYYFLSFKYNNYPLNLILLKSLQLSVSLAVFIFLIFKNKLCCVQHTAYRNILHLLVVNNITVFVVTGSTRHIQCKQMHLD